VHRDSQTDAAGSKPCRDCHRRAPAAAAYGSPSDGRACTV